MIWRGCYRKRDKEEHRMFMQELEVRMRDEPWPEELTQVRLLIWF